MADQVFKNALLDLDCSEDSFAEVSKQTQAKWTNLASCEGTSEFSAWQPIRRPTISKELSTEKGSAAKLNNGNQKQQPFDIRRGKVLVGDENTKNKIERSPIRVSKVHLLDKLLTRNRTSDSRSVISQVSPASVTRLHLRKKSLMPNGIGQAILADEAPRLYQPQIYADIGDLLRKTLGSFQEKKGYSLDNSNQQTLRITSQRDSYTECQKRIHYALQQRPSHSRKLRITNTERNSLDMGGESLREHDKLSTLGLKAQKKSTNQFIFKPSAYENKESSLLIRPSSRPSELISGSTRAVNRQHARVIQANINGKKINTQHGSEHRNLLRIDRSTAGARRQASYDLDSIANKIETVYQSLVGRRADVQASRDDSLCVSPVYGRPCVSSGVSMLKVGVGCRNKLFTVFGSQK